MKKILELTEENERMLSQLINVALKSEGLNAFHLVNKLLAEIKTLQPEVVSEISQE